MRIILHGYTGKMGQIVADTVSQHPEHEIIARAAIDAGTEAHCYKDLNDITEEADVLIDFSNHLSTAAVMDFCVKRNLPAVICTTGQTEEEKRIIEEAGKSIPVFFSANMSLGIAVLCDLVKKAAGMFPDADIEIMEVHHNRKLDVPSGTALMIADAIRTVRPQAVYNIGRQPGKRTKEEIGISSLRMGNEVGTHEIYIHTETECITLRHNAYTRAVFADGALQAMVYLAGKPAGLYTMADMVGE